MTSFATASKTLVTHVGLEDIEYFSNEVGPDAKFPGSFVDSKSLDHLAIDTEQDY